MTYLCYDLKGIQQFIFQIPKLKYCIGGSRLVDEFDRTDAPALDLAECRHIYSGGGKGAYQCATTGIAEELKAKLVQIAHSKGLTIRFGISEDYTQAATEITETYCYQPESLEGQPCQESGLYPATDSIHPIVRERLDRGVVKGMKCPVEKKFLEAIRQRCSLEDAEFFYDVDADNGRRGEEGSAALGSRGRWAVVCMDGNDMGKQFHAYRQENHPDEEWIQWLGGMSEALDQCTCLAAADGMCAVVEECRKNEDRDFMSKILPIRPLIIGGDDVTVLVHCSYASVFVKKVMEKFTEYSKGNGRSRYWVGTGGELSISAGILYAPVTLPLHNALEYAESLLASAKTRGRTGPEAKTAAVPCIDWESVTEGVLSAPHIRREELKFRDETDGKTMILTRRPYTLQEYEALEKKAGKMEKIPVSIRYQITRALAQNKAERLAFYAKIAKNWPGTAAELKEPWDTKYVEYGPGWVVNGDIVTTDIPDRFLLLEERKRMEFCTAGQNSEED